jgi:hypothetical protein
MTRYMEDRLVAYLLDGCDDEEACRRVRVSLETFRRQAQVSRAFRMRVLYAKTWGAPDKRLPALFADPRERNPYVPLTGEAERTTVHVGQYTGRG